MKMIDFNNKPVQESIASSLIEGGKNIITATWLTAGFFGLASIAIILVGTSALFKDEDIKNQEPA